MSLSTLYVLLVGCNEYTPSLSLQGPSQLLVEFLPLDLPLFLLSGNDPLLGRLGINLPGCNARAS